MNFIDLQGQFKLYREEMMAEIGKVLESAQFIMGPMVRDFEAGLASFAGVKHAICCASGTDALTLGLLAKGIKAGDEIIVPDFTFFATAEVVANLGATPVFVDIDPSTYNIDVQLLAKKTTKRTKGIIPVSLYGQCADMDEINDIAGKKGLWVMEDAAQSFGASYHGRRSASLSDLAATSFYPAKPLGCYGDGGAVFTNDDALAQVIREILNHGQAGTYTHVRLGINGRLDALQAAVLTVKLRHFEDELKRRNAVAGWYTKRLQGAVRLQSIREGNISAWAQFTVAHEKRETIIAHIKGKGIPVAIHYPKPLHAQPALQYLKQRDDDYPVSVKASREVFSLPMHPFLTEDEVEVVSTAIKEAL